MTFLEIQNAVLTDRFAEGKRGEAKNWINSRYGRLWAIEPWSFKIVAVTHALVADETTVSLSDLGLQKIHAVYTNYNTGNYELLADRPEDFARFSVTTNGRNTAFTVLGDVLTLDRPYSSAQTLTVVGELKWVPLVDDGDVPLIPAEFHWMLVHGATSEGLRIENDPTWQGAEQDWNANLTDLRMAYYSPVTNYGDVAPSFTPYWGW